MTISFATAKTVKTVAKAKKADKVRVEMNGMHEYAALVSVMKSLEAVKASMEAEIKADMLKKFVDMGCDKQARPANFIGFEGDGEASCELRARSSVSGLTEAEQEILADHEIPTTVVEDVVDTFVINPQYITDASLMDKVAAKLNTIKDIPSDFILKQEGRAKTVVAEGGLDAVFKNSPEVAANLLKIVGTLAIKAKFTDMEKALDAIKEFVVAA